MHKELSANTELSHYRIVSKIGAGGMGEVYLAEDPRLRRKIALKVLPDILAQDKDRLRRFEQEALAASALNHPNILTIHEFGLEGEMHYLASEFIDGETLRARLQRTPLTLSNALDIAVQIAQALVAAHEARIIHRDIKPENVMIRKDGIVKVLDFGLAKLDAAAALDAEAETRKLGLTQAGTVMGTVAYMSPEQARGQTVDPRTDIFSLGAVLYEMLAGRQPFLGETVNHVIVAILEQELPPFVQKVPAELDCIVKRMLAKKLADRYTSAQAMLADLKKLQKRLEYEAQFEGPPAPNESDEARTLMLQQRSAAAPEANATSAVSAQPTTPDKPKTQNRRWIALLSLLVLVGGFLGYRSLTSTKQIESIAVLPFVNASGNADVEYLSDGMTETLIKSLLSLPNLNVKPRSSVFRYKGKETDLQTIAKELNVQAVLNGRVDQRGDQLTVSLELVDVQKDSVIWTEQYQRKQTDLVSLQSDIAKDVSTNLKARLSGADVAKVTKSYTADSEAYQLYLKGRFHWNKRTYDDLLKAIEHFKAAVHKDDGFALAYSGLADSYSILPYYRGSKSSEFMEQAKPYAIRSVEIDNQLAEAHTALAFVNEGTWNWVDAEREYKRAIELNPNYPVAQMRYARFEVRVPRRDIEGLTRIKRALELEPWSLVINDNLSQIYLAQGDVDHALQQARRTVELDPAFSFGWVDLAYAQLKKGQNVEALASAEEGVDVSKRSSRTLICLGFVNAVVGRRSEAVAILKELEGKYQNGQSDAAEVAAVYAGLGDTEQAFIWLDKAFGDHSSLLVDLRAEFPFASLLDDPRYKDFRKRMNMPE